MKSSTIQSSFVKPALLALSCTALLALTAAPALKAADLATLQPRADAPAAPATAALPLDVKIEKAAGKEKAFVVKLTNHSKSSLKVTAKVLLAVAFHGEEKARRIPAHTIEAGKEWSIDELVFDDHVVVTAEGFAPLEIKVK
jgi:hypothetical protein